MPLYEYVCDACSHSFEVRQGFNDEPVCVCPKCSKKKVRRVISPAPIIFKGSGFYVTDYRSPSPTTGGAKDTGADKAAAPAPAAAPAAEAPKKAKS